MAQVKMFQVAASKAAAIASNKQHAHQKLVGESANAKPALKPKPVTKKTTTISRQSHTKKTVKLKAKNEKAKTTKSTAMDPTAVKMHSALKIAATAMAAEKNTIQDQLNTVSKNGIQASKDEKHVLEMAQKVKNELQKIPQTLRPSELGESDENGIVEKLEQLVKDASSDLTAEKTASTHDKTYVQQASHVIEVLSHKTRPAKLVEDMSKNARNIHNLDKKAIGEIVKIEKAEAVRDKLKAAAAHERDVAQSEVASHQRDQKEGQRIIAQATQIIGKLSSVPKPKDTPTSTASKHAAVTTKRKSTPTAVKNAVKKARNSKKKNNPKATTARNSKKKNNPKGCDAKVSQAEQVA